MFELLSKSLVVFQKDLKLEFRRRYALNAIAMFALTTLVTVSFSIGPLDVEPAVAAPLLWIILFFSAMSGLSHIFIREEEQQTADTLRLVLPPNAVWLGKWLFNVLLLFALELIVVPMFCLMMNISVENLTTFVLIVTVGSIALSSVATIIAAIISLTSSRGALFAVLSLPIALPVLISGIEGTRMAMHGAAFERGLPDLQILFSFSVVIITISALVFEFIWRK